jgi:hypothetical protein
MTQNLERFSPSDPRRPLSRTVMGGLCPVDFPRLIDAILLPGRMQANALELKTDAPEECTVSGRRALERTIRNDARYQPGGGVDFTP